MTTLRSALGVLAVALSLFAALGCSSKASNCVGRERCACFADQTCRTGLSCFSNVCVNVQDASVADVPIGGTSGGGGATTGSGGTTGAGGAGGTTVVGTGGLAAGGTGAGPADAGVGGAPPGSGGTVAAGGAPVGTGGTANLGGAGGVVSSSGGMVGTGGGAGGTPSCRLFETKPESTVPTVFLLVDRSGSMFDCLSGSVDAGDCVNAWDSLKTGVLQAVTDLQASVRFGFGAFTGEKTSACPVFDKLAPALNNADAIATLYNSLGAPTKGETPTSQVLATVGTLLTGDPGGGQKYILFVTDGEPDFCDDGNPDCPYDAVVHRLQVLKAAGVTTLVFGIQSKLSTLSTPSLQAFANAGAGQGVQLPGAVTPLYLYSECMSTAGWKSEYTAAGRTGSVPIADYGTSGTATVYQPDPTNQQALTALLSKTIAGVKSCFFDLVDGLSVDTTKLDQAHVSIEGQEVPRDDANGWMMLTAARLKLSGTACTTWQQPQSRTIDIRFPCGVVHAD